MAYRAIPPPPRSDLDELVDIWRGKSPPRGQLVKSPRPKSESAWAKPKPPEWLQRFVVRRPFSAVANFWIWEKYDWEDE